MLNNNDNTLTDYAIASAASARWQRIALGHDEANTNELAAIMAYVQANPKHRPTLRPDGGPSYYTEAEVARIFAKAAVQRVHTLSDVLFPITDQPCPE